MTNSSRLLFWLFCTAMSNAPDQFADESPHVLVVGAGINGAAVARELILNGVSVTIVDANDIAFGATSRSSRLIHGGLRYLERGDVRLVFESLRERAILLRIAPQFVQPLRLQIPVRRRCGGLIWGLLTLLGCERTWIGKLWLRCCPNAKERGLWVIGMGLRIYDWLAARSGDQETPTHSVTSIVVTQTRQFDSSIRWLCEYSDAQISFPERFVVTLLADAQRVAQQQDLACEILTHTIAQFSGSQVWLHDRLGQSQPKLLSPTIVINATGAWGDATLADWNVVAQKLFGGTKGSHFVTTNAELRNAIGMNGLYAEAADGRLVFILPFGPKQTLVGTTDEPFSARPDTAVAEPREIEYLIQLVNAVVPSARLSASDVLLTCSGVRPLPFGRDDSPSSIPRGHWIDENSRGPVPILTLIGGKLTTCRKLAEEVADRVLLHLNRPRIIDSRGGLLPGAQNFPKDDAALQSLHRRFSQQFGLSVAQVESVWPLIGNRFEEVFPPSFASGISMESADVDISVADTNLPRRFVKWVIKEEWVRSLSDLVERRLMLLYETRLTARCLQELTEMLAEKGIISRERIAVEVIDCIERLHRVYGREIL